MLLALHPVFLFARDGLLVRHYAPTIALEGLVQALLALVLFTDLLQVLASNAGLILLALLFLA